MAQPYVTPAQEWDGIQAQYVAALGTYNRARSRAGRQRAHARLIAVSRLSAAWVARAMLRQGMPLWPAQRHTLCTGTPHGPGE